MAEGSKVGQPRITRYWRLALAVLVPAGLALAGVAWLWMLASPSKCPPCEARRRKVLAWLNG